MNDSLSKRGQLAGNSPARVDLEIYFEASQNIYDAVDNPEGTFPMNIAENKLNWKTLQSKIQEINKSNKVPGWASRYGNPTGVESFKEAVASFLEKFLFEVPVDPNSLAFSSGLTSVIEQTAYVLADPGDVAVIPAPSYPVYTSDLGVKSGIERFDLTTHISIDELSNGLLLTTDHLDKVLDQINRSKKTFKMLILTSPDNPTGGIYSQAQLKSIAAWCIQHSIHLIVNEIYARSLIDTEHPFIKSDYSYNTPYDSFGKMMHEYKSPYLHWWYSFSKDFGVSGFRVGALHSWNEELIKSYGNINLTHGVSNLTQWVLQEILSDHSFVSDYLKTNQRLLTDSYATVAQSLRALGIPYNPSRGSLFIWTDLSEFLDVSTDQGEEALWMEVYENTGILMTPANGFGHQKKGQFRLVVTYFNSEELTVAMNRFARFIHEKRNK